MQLIVKDVCINLKQCIHVCFNRLKQLKLNRLKQTIANGYFNL